MKFYGLTFAVAVFSLAVLAAGCGSTENKAKESAPETPAAAAPKAKEPVLYTGQEAFNRMMGLALKWSPDAQPAGGQDHCLRRKPPSRCASVRNLNRRH